MQTWLPHPATTAAGPLRDWLTARGSLSERIRARCGAGFRVVPLFQGAAAATPGERRALELGRGRPLVREVLLLCGDTPVVFARSLAAAQYLAGPWRALRGLGSRPLATMLFADPRIVRGPLEYCRVDARATLHRHAQYAVAGLPGALWARRSVFRRAGAPLLVTELFLPGILAL